MANGGIILEPVKEFNSYYKQAIVDNANKMFEGLAEKSQVSEEVNQEIIKRLRKAELNLSNHKRKQSGIRAWRVFLFVLLIGAALSSIFCIYCLVSDAHPSFNRIGLICGTIGLILLGIGLVVLDFTQLRKKIKHLQELIDKAQAKVNDITREAWDQMSPLFKMFDWRQTLQLVEMTCPQIHIDEVFDVRKLDFLKRNYDFRPITYEDKDHSILNVLSGTMCDNPFLIVKQLSHKMGVKTYSGSILNTYTVWVGSGDDRHMETRTETLIATVTKPHPYYSEYNYIVYGNEAAGKLIFNRIPSGVGIDEKDSKVDKIVKKGSKRLDKLEKRALSDGDDNTNFTKMGNEKFDVLFGATDRNNEVEFRLLFPPSVQINMTDLILHGLYGDDFTFNKRCCINIIYTNHSQGFDYSCNYSNYVDIEFKECRRKFVDYNVKFFNCLYFDLAPLLSITLYQSTKPRMFTYKNVYDRMYTSYEDEAMANALGYHRFDGAGFGTQSILKAKYMKTQGTTDYSIITSHSYRVTEAVEIVPKLGSDGDWHNVPVTYEVFTPVSHDTMIGTARYEGSEGEYSGLQTNKSFKDFISRLGPVCSIIKNRGLLGFIVGDPSTANTDYDIKNLYK